MAGAPPGQVLVTRDTLQVVASTKVHSGGIVPSYHFERPTKILSVVADGLPGNCKCIPDRRCVDALVYDPQSPSQSGYEICCSEQRFDERRRSPEGTPLQRRRPHAFLDGDSALRTQGELHFWTLYPFMAPSECEEQVARRDSHRKIVAELQIISDPGPPVLDLAFLLPVALDIPTHDLNVHPLASSSTISSSSMPIALSNRPLLFVCLTLVISSCSFDFTMPAGSEVKTSCLFAATRTGTCSGRLEVLPWACLFCRASRMSNRMPRSALEEVTEETAWCRSLPCPGVSRSKNLGWLRSEVSFSERYRSSEARTWFRLQTSETVSHPVNHSLDQSGFSFTTHYLNGIEKWIRHTEVNVDEQGRQQADEEVEYVYKVLLPWEVFGLIQTAAPACKLGGSGVISPDGFSEH
ncbi:hypothetical protein KC342_g54 [Hortaea werneckii]|nr:hypothetical protein KC342_g54 [Hortaea werneckii]